MHSDHNDCPHRGEHHGGHENCPHRRRVEQGWLRILFLRLIHEKPMHGYQVMGEAAERGLSGETPLEPGTAYTLLRRMEASGLLTSQWQEAASGPDRRIYTITREGVEFLRDGIRGLEKRKQVLDELVAYRDARLMEAD